MVFRNLLKRLLLLAVMMVGLEAAATVPVSGNYYIKNVKLEKYVKVTGAYSAEPNAATKADASNIRVGVKGALADGTYQMNSLASTYGADGTPVECYDYVGRALSIGTAMLKQELAGKSSENVLKAVQLMNDFVNSYAYMRLKPVEGKANTYLSVNTIPSMEKDANGKQALEAMVKLGKISEPTDAAAWEYLKGLVKKYLGTSKTDSDLKAKVLRNLDKVSLGKTYLLGGDSYSTFDYVEANADITTTDPYFEWQLVPYTAADVTESGVYKVHNVGNDLYVKVTDKYYARPNATEDEATEIHITSNGTVEGLNGQKGTKVTSLGCNLNGQQIEISNYVNRGITIGQALAKAMLSGKVTDAKQQAALDYLQQFISENSYMVIEPVAGTDYVYAYGTIPAIPDSVKAIIVKYGVTKGVAVKPANNGEVWQYLLNLVKYYLNAEGNQTDSKLKNLVLNNIDKIKEGTTYYLKADADNTFGYVAKEEANLQDPYLQWGTDVQSTDAKAQSGFYKIHNVGLDKYVNVESKYYARPNVDLADATPIHVGLNAQKADGSYDLNSLAGNTDAGQYVECYDYVDRALNIGKAAMLRILDQTTQEQGNKDKAEQFLTDFIKTNAYMTIRPVPGQSNAFFAYGTIPAIPDSVQDWIIKKSVAIGGYAKPTTREEVWPYLKNIVRYYLSKSQTDSKLKTVVLNNIDKIELGHTYYLNGDADLTFGLVDALKADYTDQHLWWGFAEAFTPTPFKGYYRIRNAKGVAGKEYMNVTGHFTAHPDLTAVEAQTAPGSVIYVKADSTKDGVSMPVTVLRSQGINVNDYVKGIQTCVDLLSQAVATYVTQELQSRDNYAKYAPLVGPMIEDVKNSIDLHYYVEATQTSKGEAAYFMKASVPDVAEYLGEANAALKLLGKDKQWLYEKAAATLGIDTTAAAASFTDKVEVAVLQLINRIDDADAFWALLKQKGISMLNDDHYFERLSEYLPADALAILRDNLASVKYGTTYCLTEDKYATLGFAERANCTEDDAAKWVLEAFDEQDSTYDASRYNLVGGVADIEYVTKNAPNTKGNPTYEPTDADDSNSYYYTTGFYDFDAQLQDVQGNPTEAYIATAVNDTLVEEGPTGNKVTRAYWLVKLKKVEGTIPAHTPVILRTLNQNGEEPNVAVKPVGEPTTAAIESDTTINGSKFYHLFIDNLGGGASPAPRKVIVTNKENQGNRLVGSLLGDKADINYLPLKKYALIEDANGSTPTLNMSGLGFWKSPSNVELEANKAYLYADGLAGFDATITTDEGHLGQSGKKAPGYILDFGTGIDGNHTITGVINVTTTKAVKSVTYFNIAGQQAQQPFEGVNIIVTRYTDGTQAVAKAVK